MMVLRATTFIVGMALLAATAHVTIEATGGYAQPHAILTIVIAIGVGVGALAIGTAWGHGRIVLACWLAAAILAGEGFGLLMTAERLVTSREAAQAPLREAEQAHANAAQRVAEALAALEAAPVSSPRLDAALAAKAAADTAVLEKSAQRGCAANCRALLQAQVDAAQKETTAARAELATSRDQAAAELADARTALTAHKVPTSPTPLADRLGLPAWALDLIAAALGSMAANGLGCGLIAFSAHGRHQDNTARVPQAANTAGEPLKVVGEIEHAAEFAVEALAPRRAGSADLLKVHQAYRQWCAARGVEPLPAAQIGAALAELFRDTGLSILEHNGRRTVKGIAIKTAQLKALPDMRQAPA